MPYPVIAVAVGRTTGIFDHWEQEDGTGGANESTKGFPRARFKGFYSIDLASEWLTLQHNFSPSMIIVHRRPTTATKIINSAENTTQVSTKADDTPTGVTNTETTPKREDNDHTPSPKKRERTTSPGHNKTPTQMH